jgi:hypothetical protein
MSFIEIHRREILPPKSLSVNRFHGKKGVAGAGFEVIEASEVNRPA